jgi:hypothetical protein
LCLQGIALSSHYVFLKAKIIKLVLKIFEELITPVETGVNIWSIMKPSPRIIYMDNQSFVRQALNAWLNTEIGNALMVKSPFRERTCRYKGQNKRVSERTDVQKRRKT